MFQFDLFLFQQSNKRIGWRRATLKLSSRNADRNDRSYRVIQETQKLQRNLTLLNLSMTVSFYLSWLPYAADCLLIMCGVTVSSKFHVIAVLFAKSGTVINPILYIFFNKEVSNWYFIFNTLREYYRKYRACGHHSITFPHF